METTSGGDRFLSGSKGGFYELNKRKGALQLENHHAAKDGFERSTFLSSVLTPFSVFHRALRCHFYAIPPNAGVSRGRELAGLGGRDRRGRVTCLFMCLLLVLSH